MPFWLRSNSYTTNRIFENLIEFIMRGGNPKILVLCALICLSAWLGCKKEKPVPEADQVDFEFSFRVGDSAMAFNTFAFQNAAGNAFSLSRLEFILSDFWFAGSAGDTSRFPSAKYINADTGPLTAGISGVPQGSYTGFGFTIGLPPELNVSNSLPNEPDFNDMYWPEPMGGGYHFMKMEGMHDASDPKGWAFHLGSDGFHIDHSFASNFTMGQNNLSVQMEMDISQWFEDPVTYDLDSMDNATMGDSLLMGYLQQNGHNVFNLLGINEE